MYYFNIIIVLWSEAGLQREVMMHDRWREETYTGFWWRNLKEIHHLEHLGTDWRMILKWILIQHSSRA